MLLAQNFVSSQRKRNSFCQTFQFHARNLKLLKVFDAQLGQLDTPQIIHQRSQAPTTLTISRQICFRITEYNPCSLCGSELCLSLLVQSTHGSLIHFIQCCIYGFKFFSRLTIHFSLALCITYSGNKGSHCQPSANKNQSQDNSTFVQFVYHVYFRRSE